MSLTNELFYLINLDDFVSVKKSESPKRLTQNIELRKENVYNIPPYLEILWLMPLIGFHKNIEILL